MKRIFRRADDRKDVGDELRLVLDLDADSENPILLFVVTGGAPVDG